MPEPETPVTQVNTPSGNFTSIFFKLFSAAPRTFSQPAGFLRFSGIGIFTAPLKYCPVMDSGVFMMSSTVPQATIRPPWEPAPGPTSTI